MDFLTPTLLKIVMPHLKKYDAFHEGSAEAYCPLVVAACQEFEIVTPARVAAFLAQMAHESGELRYWSEIWGPTKQQQKYDPPHAKAAELGNTRIGDGFKYRGHGPIQITGFHNHKKYGELLGVDLVEFPMLAATPKIGFRVAAAFCAIDAELNELADRQTLVAFRILTRNINGGLTGIEDREHYHTVTRMALGLRALDA